MDIKQLQDKKVISWRDLQALAQFHEIPANITKRAIAKRLIRIHPEGVPSLAELQENGTGESSQVSRGGGSKKQRRKATSTTTKKRKSVQTAAKRRVSRRGRQSSEDLQMPSGGQLSGPSDESEGVAMAVDGDEPAPQESGPADNVAQDRHSFLAVDGRESARNGVSIAEDATRHAIEAPIVSGAFAVMNAGETEMQVDGEGMEDGAVASGSNAVHAEALTVQEDADEEQVNTDEVDATVHGQTVTHGVSDALNEATTTRVNDGDVDMEDPLPSVTPHIDEEPSDETAYRSLENLPSLQDFMRSSYHRRTSQVQATSSSTRRQSSPAGDAGLPSTTSTSANRFLVEKQASSEIPKQEASASQSECEAGLAIRASASVSSPPGREDPRKGIKQEVDESAFTRILAPSSGQYDDYDEDAEDSYAVAAQLLTLSPPRLGSFDNDEEEEAQVSAELLVKEEEDSDDDSDGAGRLDNFDSDEDETRIADELLGEPAGQEDSYYEGEGSVGNEESGASISEEQPTTVEDDSHVVEGQEHPTEQLPRTSPVQSSNESTLRPMETEADEPLVENQKDKEQVENEQPSARPVASFSSLTTAIHDHETPVNWPAGHNSYPSSPLHSRGSVGGSRFYSEPAELLSFSGGEWSATKQATNSGDGSEDVTMSGPSARFDGTMAGHENIDQSSLSVASGSANHEVSLETGTSLVNFGDDNRAKVKDQVPANVEPRSDHVESGERSEPKSSAPAIPNEDILPDYIEDGEERTKHPKRSTVPDEEEELVDFEIFAGEEARPSASTKEVDEESLSSYVDSNDGDAANDHGAGEPPLRVDDVVVGGTRQSAPAIQNGQDASPDYEEDELEGQPSSPSATEVRTLPSVGESGAHNRSAAEERPEALLEPPYDGDHGNDIRTLNVGTTVAASSAGGSLEYVNVPPEDDADEDFEAPGIEEDEPGTDQNLRREEFEHLSRQFDQLEEGRRIVKNRVTILKKRLDQGEELVQGPLRGRAFEVVEAMLERTKEDLEGLYQGSEHFKQHGLSRFVNVRRQRRFVEGEDVASGSQSGYRRPGPTRASRQAESVVSNLDDGKAAGKKVALTSDAVYESASSSAGRESDVFEFPQNSVRPPKRRREDEDGEEDEGRPRMRVRV